MGDFSGRLPGAPGAGDTSIPRNDPRMTGTRPPMGFGGGGSMYASPPPDPVRQPPMAPPTDWKMDAEPPNVRGGAGGLLPRMTDEAQAPMPPLDFGGGGGMFATPPPDPIRQPPIMPPRDFGGGGSMMAKPPGGVAPPNVRGGAGGLLPRMTDEVNKARSNASPRIPPMAGGSQDWYGRNAPQGRPFTPPPSAGVVTGGPSDRGVRALR